jgi:hypothetical protein
MRLSRVLVILAVSVVSTPVSAAAAPIDQLFSTPHLAALTADRPIAYRHLRTGGGAGAKDLDEVITLQRGADEAHVLVTMDAEGQPRPTTFRGMTGNPILMIFLEDVVRTVSDAAGGSPFYLRNRIKAAMRDRMTEEPVTAEFGGGEVTAHRIALHPFAGDAHTEELGRFADLELSFLLADAAPGSFLSLAASAGDAGTYSEEIRLDETR